MSVEDWLALGLLAVAGAVLIIAAAAEAGVVTISRGRARLLAERGERHGATLHRQSRELAGTYAAFTVLRNAALVGGASLFAYLMLDGIDTTWLALTLAFAGALVSALLLQIVPQFLVVQRPERWALALAPLAQAVRLVFGPVAWLFTLPARAWLRMRGIETSHVDEISEAEELLRLVEMERGERIEEEEAEMIRGVIGLEDTMVREIMAPRIDIAAVEAKATVQQALDVIVERGFSRIPVYQENIDNIVGVLYAKDLLRAFASGAAPASILELTRPPHFIPEAKKVDELLRELRQRKVHIAIVVDEYGGTAGLVTIEDLLEEIVGEIEDEYDVSEVTIERISDDEAVLDARVAIDELGRLFGIEIERDDFDTVGGFVYSHLGKIPSVGDEVQVDGLRVRILSVAGRRIKKVDVRRVPPPDGAPAGAERSERAS